jgi:hypothetical protein
MRFPLLIAVAALVLVGCNAPEQTPHRTRPTIGPLPVETITGIAPACVVSPRGQADRRCDPGVLNPDVTQNTISSTICVPNWTATVRPPTSYTLRMRNIEMQLYYPASTPVTAVRYDHLVPLELGGHPTDLDNLWPQPVGPDVDKNTHGGRLKDRVCRGEITLEIAQQEILDTWTH